MSALPVLPQNDPDQAQRQKQLAKAQAYYQFDFTAFPAWPFASKTPLPKLRWVVMVGLTLVTIGINLLLAVAMRSIDKLLGNIKDNRATTLKAFDHQFVIVDRPQIAEQLQDDALFVRLRVAGFNPALIVGVDRLPANFPVSDAILRKVDGFGNDSLDTAGKEGRLYLADYRVLEPSNFVVSPSDARVPYTPMALFAVPKGGKSLRAVAIQCGQDPKQYPILGPNDGYAWQMAKTAVNCSDAKYHELISHLIHAHMMQEPLALCTPRCLAENHPVYVLLMPHFEGTLLINKITQKQLLHEGSAYGTLLSGTWAKNFDVAIADRKNWPFNRSGLPQNLADRKVDNKAALPDYPFRDDAELIWNAIAEWVSAYLDVYYKNDSDVANDTELQNWGATLVSQDGGRVADFGEDAQGGIKTLAYLKQAVTTVIYVGTAWHASVNFPQKPHMAYVPAVPFCGYAAVPSQPGGTLEDFLSMLPPVGLAQHQVNTGVLLGTVHYTRLGEYEPGHFQDERVTPALKAFQDALEKAETTITERNKSRDVPYTFLLPSNIPQSINV